MDGEVGVGSHKVFSVPVCDGRKTDLSPVCQLTLHITDCLLIHTSLQQSARKRARKWGAEKSTQFFSLHAHSLNFVSGAAHGKYLMLHLRSFNIYKHTVVTITNDLIWEIPCFNFQAFAYLIF